MSNTITAYFKGRTGVAEAVYQNDYGIVMEFDGIYLPAHFDCYFSRANQEKAIPGVGADNRVAIPNSILANSGNVTIHIPLHTGASDSEVEYVVNFNVIGRARPIDDGTPAQMTAVEHAIALLQQPIANIKEIVNEALGTDGYITESKLSDALKLKAIKDYVTPEMFGAKGDGIADDTEALQLCANASMDVCIKNTYYMTSRVEFDNVKMFGGGTIKMSPSNESTLISRLEFNSCVIENIRFESSNIYPSVWLDEGLYSNVYILTSNTRFQGCKFVAIEDIRSQDADFIAVENCVFSECANGVLGTNSAKNYINNCTFDILDYGGAYAHAIYLGGACNVNYILNCTFDGCQYYPIHTYNSSEYANGYLTYVQNCRIRNCANGIASNTVLTIIDNCDMVCSAFAFFLNGDSVIHNCVVDCDRILLCTHSSYKIDIKNSQITLRTFTSPEYIYSFSIYSNGNRWIQKGEQSSFLLYVGSSYEPQFFMQNDVFIGWSSSSGLFSVSKGVLKLLNCYVGEASLVAWMRTTAFKTYFVGNVYEATNLATGTPAVNQNNVSINGL